MSTPIVSPDLRSVNSTTYADLVGLQLGLGRLPEEESQAFLARLYQAEVARRDHSYQGTLNEIALQLGLNTRVGIQISSTDPNATISADVAGVQLQSGNTVTTKPLFTIQPDTVWQWRKLSDLVADINATAGFSATLLSADGPALQVAKQSNVYTVTEEAIAGFNVQLQHAGLIVASLAFSQPVPAFTASTTGAISFVSELPANTTVTYQYRVLPYGLVCSDASVIGLTETNLASAAVSNGVLAYQVREALQEIMSKDRSYWSR